MPLVVQRACQRVNGAMSVPLLGETGLLRQVKARLGQHEARTIEVSVPQRDDAVPPPIFNAIPPAVLLLAGAILLAGILGAISGALAEWMFTAFVVVAAPEGVTMSQPLGPLAPYVLHILIHFGFLHIAMNLAILIGAGRPVGLAFGGGLRGTAGFLGLFLTCSAAGAVAQVLIPTAEVMTMGGASTGVSGLLAAAGWVTGGWRGMARLALPWIGLNLLIAVTGFVFPVPIGWAAHIGGTVAGALLTPLFLAIFAERRL